VSTVAHLEFWNAVDGFERAQHAQHPQRLDRRQVLASATGRRLARSAVRPAAQTTRRSSVPLASTRTIVHAKRFFTHSRRYSFIPGLKRPFSANPPHRSLPFLLPN